MFENSLNHQANDHYNLLKVYFAVCDPESPLYKDAAIQSRLYNILQERATVLTNRIEDDKQYYLLTANFPPNPYSDDLYMPSQYPVKGKHVKQILAERYLNPAVQYAYDMIVSGYSLFSDRWETIVREAVR